MAFLLNSARQMESFQAIHIFWKRIMTGQAFLPSQPASGTSVCERIARHSLKLTAYGAIQGRPYHLMKCRPPNTPQLSPFNSSDMHRQLRQHGTTYSVKTISLVDLLRKHSAPPIIDYLSIDTEGSEYDILSSFDFSSYRFRVITCEHNFMPAREQILALLTRNGYSRTLTKFSQYDDWYFDAELSS